MKQGVILEKDNINAIIMTNDGQFLSIPAKESWNIGETVTISEFEQKLKNRNNNKKGFLNKSKISVALIAILLIFIMPFALISEASTYITLDINPSMEFELKNDKVVNIRALNSDGEKLIAQFYSENNLLLNESDDIFSITSLMLKEAEKMGYLKTNEENIIIVGVSNDKEFKSLEYEQYIKNKLSINNISAQVIVLSATSNEKKSADEKGISLGRQLLLEKEQAEGILISDEEITNGSIKNIFKTIEEEKRKNDLNKANDKNNERAKQPNTNSEDKEKDGSKQEERQNNGDKKDKTEDKKELANREQDEKQKNEDSNQKKIESKEADTIEAEKINEDNDKDKAGKESGQDNKNKENKK